MKSKWMVAALLVLCVCIISDGVLAQPQGGRGRQGQAQGGRMMGGGMFGGLDLTEEQQAKMAKIREGIMGKMQNATSEERREIFTKMREQMQAVLTEEQRAKAANMMGDRGMGSGRPGGEGATRPGIGAGQAQRQRTMGPLDLFDAVSRRLELSKEQQDKIAKIRAEAMKKLMKDIKSVLTKEQRGRFEQAQKRLAEAQQNRQPQGRQPRAEGDRPAREGDRPARRGEAREGDSGERRERGGEGRTRGGEGRERRERTE